MTKTSEIKFKYDLNNDDLVTIDEYLAKELSAGPKAVKTRINYNYQDYENIFNYFYILFLNLKQFKILCIPNSILIYNNNATRVAVAFDQKKEKILIANNMRQSIKKCIDKERTRFIFFTFILIPKNVLKTKITHANMIIIDLSKKTIERFEPYGSLTVKFEEKMDKLFKTKILEKLDLEDFEYLSPTDICPKIGIQRIADSFCGMCITISMMYLHLRILNPDIKQSKLIKYIITRPKKKLKEMILKYAKHVEEKLKENELLVLDLFNDFYIDLKDSNFFN